LIVIGAQRQVFQFFGADRVRRSSLSGAKQPFLAFDRDRLSKAGSQDNFEDQRRTGREANLTGCVRQSVSLGSQGISRGREIEESKVSGLVGDGFEWRVWPVTVNQGQARTGYQFGADRRVARSGADRSLNAAGYSLGRRSRSQCGRMEKEHQRAQASNFRLAFAFHRECVPRSARKETALQLTCDLERGDFQCRSLTRKTPLHP